MLRRLSRKKPQRPSRVNVRLHRRPAEKTRFLNLTLFTNLISLSRMPAPPKNFH